MITPQEVFMRAAIEVAKESRQKGDYAIGAIVVKEGEIIARGNNRSRIDSDPTQHSEMVAIRAATKFLGSRHIKGCVLYTTHEPCPMCAAAVVWAKMDGVVSGATIEDMAGYHEKNQESEWTWRTIHISAAEVFAKAVPDRPQIVEGFMRDECKELFHS